MRTRVTVLCLFVCLFVCYQSPGFFSRLYDKLDIPACSSLVFLQYVAKKNLRSGREDSRLVLECYVTSYSWRHLHEVRYSLHVYMWCVSHETGHDKFRIHVHMSCVCSQHVHESVMIFVKVLRTS